MPCQWKRSSACLVQLLGVGVWSYSSPIKTTEMALCLIHPYFFPSSTSLFYPYGGDQDWRQWSVSSYTRQRLFVEKAQAGHTMVKGVLNLPFRNSSSMWTDVGLEQSKATCRVIRWNRCVRKNLCTWSDGSLTTSELCTTFCPCWHTNAASQQNVPR